MSVSGGSSNSSVMQEEYLLRRMHKTPGTPIKSGYQLTPRKSESKRSLFQTSSPSDSDDLGFMSPLSPSSCSSANSFDSPQFSPNGKFSTPPRTPNQNEFSTRCSPRIASKKIEIKSSLFPDLKLHSPKIRNTPRTPRMLVSKMLTPQSSVDSNGAEKKNEILMTPLKSRNFCLKPENKEKIVSESDSSPSVYNSTQENEEYFSDKQFNKITKLGIKPLSCESFYGSKPMSIKAKTTLFIDTLEPRSRGRELTRSFSKESLASNRSFVSGGTRKRTQSNSRRSKSSTGDRRKVPHAGVWHNIKKPKQIKKIVKCEKPLISPQSRLAKMLKAPNRSEIKVKSKPLFQENPRKRIARPKKRIRKDTDDGGIIDSFPDHLIKRRKLPAPLVNVHPAVRDIINPAISLPDPNKKFLKYGQTRAATFTLNDNVKLQFSDGVIKLQTPKKRRKLYSGKKDVIEDFNDFDEGDNNIEQNIQGILNRLHSDKELNSHLKTDSEIKKVTSLEFLNNNENFNENKNKISPSKSGPKIRRSPLKSVSNLPMLICNDFESDEENMVDVTEPSFCEKKSNELTLGKTGNMVSYLTNILINKDTEADKHLTSENIEDETENLPASDEKYYSVFYKQNWNKLLAVNQMSSKNCSNKKKIVVPDDQYLLDAGQKSIGIVTCKKCGVMYQTGDFADEATHSNFHNHLPELRFAGWNNERVVGKYPDGRVIMILGADPKAWWQKVLKIVEIVDQELGFPEASVQSLFYKTVYLYVNEKTKQIAGCLIAEECKVAYKMFPPLEGVEIDSCSKDPTPCKVGISRIWTALSHRRKGVATKMIDCLRRTFLFGEIVAVDQVAFSAPSPAGKLLAQKVTNAQDFLVYGFA